MLQVNAGGGRKTITAEEGETKILNGHYTAGLLLKGSGTVVLKGSVDAEHNAVTVSPDARGLSFVNKGAITDAHKGFYDVDGGTGSLASFANSGTIKAAGTAVLIHSSGAAQFSFTNSGTLHAHNGSGADLWLAGANGNAFANSGTIISDRAGGVDVSAPRGPTSPDIPSIFTNSGTIEGEGIGLSTLIEKVVNSGHVTSSADTGLNMNSFPGTIMSLVNSGTIEGQTGAFLYGDSDVTSSGHISGGNTGIYLASDGHVALDNSGTIDALYTAVRTSADSVSIVNEAGSNITSGTAIDSPIYGDSCSIVNAGTITGDVTLEGQNREQEDVGATIRNTGAIYGAIDLSDGSDVLDSRGGRTDGLISGKAGDDVIHGGADGTSISGDLGDDSLYGEDGNDRLDGGDGADHLFGGAGDDVLTGGAGKDILHGGSSGKDRFVFTDAADAAGTHYNTCDHIHDWHAGDRIDLSAIDAIDAVHATGKDHAFSFIGTAAFDGHAGELRYGFQDSHTMIYADVDGDGHTDFALAVSGHVTLTKTDFVL